MWTETYSEYHADCEKCNNQILEVIEYMDIESWDEESGVCPKCRVVLCKDCVKYTDKAGYICPYCFGELLEFDYVYDLIMVIENNYQPFEIDTKKKKPEPINTTIEKLESILEELKPDKPTRERILKKIRELKVQDMFEHGQKQLF